MCTPSESHYLGGANAVQQAYISPDKRTRGATSAESVGRTIDPQSNWVGWHKSVFQTFDV